MKNASQKNKCRFLHSEWRFLHSIFFRSVLNFLLKKNRYRYFSPLKIEKSPFWMEISPFKCFSEAFLILFWKKHLQGIFSIQNGEISILNEDFSINFFQNRFWFFIEKQTPQIIFSIQNRKNLHSEWRFLHSIFFSEVVWTLKKSPQIIFSIQFFQKCVDFFWKQSLQRIFSIQNGEISILNGDFSIHFFFRRVLNFKKNIYREFSPFRMEKSPFWMEISPFKCFSEAFLFFFFWKKPLQGIFSIQNGEISILNEDSSILFFQKCFD